MHRGTVLGDANKRPVPKNSPVMHCQRRYYQASCAIPKWLIPLRILCMCWFAYMYIECTGLNVLQRQLRCFLSSPCTIFPPSCLLAVLASLQWITIFFKEINALIAYQDVTVTVCKVMPVKLISLSWTCSAKSLVAFVSLIYNIWLFNISWIQCILCASMRIYRFDICVFSKFENASEINP